MATVQKLVEGHALRGKPILLVRNCLYEVASSVTHRLRYQQ